MKAMILAAGRGERMRPLTDSTPKALLEARGRALIERHVEALAQAGMRDIVINLAWLGDRIRSRLGNGERFGVRIAYSDEGSSALETGGGILKALPLLGDNPFWLVNGDVYAEFSFHAPRLEDHVLAHLFLVPNPPHNPGGDFALTDGRVVSLPGSPAYTFSGLSVIRPALVEGSEPGAFPLTPLLTTAAMRGEVTGELFTGTWWDVGTPERLQQLNGKPG
jgi:MurNAc alpha-1-phosphate uridylyltransferase